MRAEAKEGEKTGVLRWEQSINYEANPRRFRNNSIGAVGIERWEKCDDERLL